MTNALVFSGLLKLLKWGLRLPERSPTEGVAWLREDRFQPLLSLNDVDWTRTKAYARFGLGQIVINDVRRGPRGSVQAGEYDQLRAEIVAKLRDLRDPRTGQLIGGDVFTRDEVYDGPYRDEAPDITYLPLEANYMANVLMGFTTREWIIDNPALFGNHRMDGIIVAHGRHVSPGRRLHDARIIDVAPTVLHLMGETVPSDMDGRVLTEMFTREFRERSPVARSAPAAAGAGAAHGLSPEDEESLVERLKALGYL